MWVLVLLSVPAAWAGGPRFVTGNGLATGPGIAEGWNTTQLVFFTDPGDLSSGVSHARADAMVAAAATVWNVPSSTLSLAQGGELAEHVSSANSYFDGSRFVFPADVQASNEAAIPVAVIYDTDGSVTDLLLGSGASEPLECRQNGVTQSVDDIQSDGHIHHALVVLNGRCVGAEPEQLTQMQYQLARAFGRVLGLAWSQTNDNVFTAASPVTADQEAYWPLMHPLDVLCGGYTYQCMINPFTLRPDDLSSLAGLYPVLVNNVPQGKQASDADGIWVQLIANFPTGQGMQGVNFTARRQRAGVLEDFEMVSGVTGALFQQALASPITGTQAVNQGTWNPYMEGLVSMRVIKVNGLSDVYVSSEAINPLYTAEYALGPYPRPSVTPSGAPQTWIGYSATPYPDIPNGATITMAGAASSCAPGDDGTEGAPATLDPSGWQSGLFCGWGHTSWWGATVRAGRSWTLEVTATDETGAATINKAQPVLGVWNAKDATGTPPTVASAVVPFNSMALGVTQIQMPAAASDTPLRLAVGDQYAAGRPDFTYTARLLYADAVSPASVGSGGGVITITGTGFRQGNLVQVNGAAAAVQSWTATQIVALVPSRATAGATVGTPVPVSVTDTSTHGTTAVSRALTYTDAPDQLVLVSAPPTLTQELQSTTPFAMRVLASDGVTPLPGATVRFAVSAGAASFGLCGESATCTGTSDTNGQVSTPVTAHAAGSLTLTATELSGGATVQVSLNVSAVVRAAAFSNPSVYVAAGAGGTWDLQLNVTQDGLATAGVPVVWSVSQNLVVGSQATATDGSGAEAIAVSATALASGAVGTVTGCVWSTVCATWTVVAVDPSQWQISVSSGAGQSVSQGGTLAAVGLLVTDGAGHPLQGALVNVYQRVLGWEGPCSTTGPCPAAPVLASTEASAVSDGNGLLAVTPLQVPGVPQTVELAASTGLIGFVTLTLVKTPVGP